MSIYTRASGSSGLCLPYVGVGMKNFEVPIIGEGMKHETEINYLKNRLNDIAADIALIIRALGQAGIIEFTDKEIKVNKVKLDEQSDIQ